MKKVTIAIFLKQLLVVDLFGKDSQRGVSLTYAWLANQLGHFTLGFIPTITFSLLLTKLGSSLFWMYSVCLFWIGFEIFNLIIPLYIDNRQRLFPLDLKHLIFDTITDILYFCFGSIFACLLLNPKNKTLQLVSIFNLILLFYPFIYWYTQRIYQQYAYFPFQFRLSQWTGKYIDQSEQSNILSYINTCSRANRGNHLLIYGKVAEGKSNLGVAIGNEIALQNKTCMYITATKLYSLFYCNLKNIDLHWTWKEADNLIIDDIKPDKLKHITNSDFLQYVDKFSNVNKENRNHLKNKNVIWVLGDCLDSKKEQWKDLLKEIGVPSNKIKTIDISN